MKNETPAEGLFFNMHNIYSLHSGRTLLMCQQQTLSAYDKDIELQAVSLLLALHCAATSTCAQNRNSTGSYIQDDSACVVLADFFPNQNQ